MSANTKIFTETQCARCGKVDRKQRYEGTIIPVGWAELELTYRREGSGWTNNSKFVNSLCPECADKVRDFAIPSEPIPEQKKQEN